MNMNMNMNMNMQPMVNNNQINIVFKAINDVKYNLVCNKGLTVSQVFQEYLIRIGKPNLFDNNSNIIEFIYNGKTIDFRNNNTKIEEFFGNRNSVEIQIITNDLIGA